MSRRPRASVLRGRAHRRCRPLPVPRRQMWTYTTKSEVEARAASLYLRYKLSVPCRVYVGTVFAPEGNGLPTWEIQALTTRALVEEAALFAGEVTAQGWKVGVVDGEMWTVKPLLHGERQTKQLPPGERLTDHLTPVGMICGQPVYELPSPEQASEITLC